MCDNCNAIKLYDYFPCPQSYLECLKYIKELLRSETFELVEQSCNIDEVQDKNGKWIDDVIGHVIRCKSCGQCFSCSVVTYRGQGAFRKGR